MREEIRRGDFVTFVTDGATTKRVLGLDSYLQNHLNEKYEVAAAGRNVQIIFGPNKKRWWVKRRDIKRVHPYPFID